MCGASSRFQSKGLSQVCGGLAELSVGQIHAPERCMRVRGANVGWRQRHETLELFDAGCDLSAGDELDAQHEAGRRIGLRQSEVLPRLLTVSRFEVRVGEHLIRARVWPPLDR